MIGNFSIRAGSLLLSAAFLIAPSTAGAQAFDPRPSLNMLISAFQRCGPPAAYQMLSPYLFTLIAQQTGGSGCYPFIANAGAVTDMRVIDTRQFPVGPVFAIRVTHAAGPVDWFIGFDRNTGRIEYLTYQTVASGTMPSVARGPDPDKTIGGVEPTVDPEDPSEPDAEDDEGEEDEDEEDEPRTSRNRRSGGEQSADLSEACRKFPQMCP